MTEDWLDVLTALIAAEARFLVVGAHALAVHGVPRATQDLDLWIEPTEENAARVWSALVRFGARLEELGITGEDLERPDMVIQLGLPPNRPTCSPASAVSPASTRPGRTGWSTRCEGG